MRSGHACQLPVSEQLRNGRPTCSATAQSAAHSPAGSPTAMSSPSALAAARAAWRVHATACTAAAAGAPHSLGLTRRFASASGGAPTEQQQQPQPSEAAPQPSEAAPQQAAAGANAAASSADDDVDADGFRLVYRGFFSRPHKRLKVASLLNSFASFAAAPAILSYSTASPIARVAVSSSVLAFALLTTGALHWFTAPYVHAAHYCEARDELRVSSLRLLGSMRVSTFPVSEVGVPAGYHPLASFTARGRTYYIDRANFSDAALLERLVPGSAAGAAEAEGEAASDKRQQQDEREGGQQQQQQHQQQQQQQQ